MDIPKLLSIWQPVGFSTHIIASKVSEKFKILTSHTGTLDPMAEGVIIVLLGEERHKKHEYTKWLKEYEFEMVFGLSTDTYDGLGLVTSFHETHVQEKALEEVLKGFKGEYVQDVPPYSSARVKGKALHYFARNKLLRGIEIPKKIGEIYEIELLEFYSRGFSSVVSIIKEKINKISGDLRQEQIKTRWAKLKESLSEEKMLQIAKIRVKMSRGMYVRSLSQDIAEKLHATGFVCSLVRTANGKYKKENTKTLEKVFGRDYLKNYNFTSRYRSNT